METNILSLIIFAPLAGAAPDQVPAGVDPGLPGPQSWKALKQRLKTAGHDATVRAKTGVARSR